MSRSEKRGLLRDIISLPSMTVAMRQGEADSGNDAAISVVDLFMGTPIHRAMGMVMAMMKVPQGL